MPLLMDEFKQLGEEVKQAKKGDLPPLISFVISVSSAILAFILAFFMLFPFLRSVFLIGLFLALFLSLGAFIILSAFLGEVITVLLQGGKSQKA